MRRRDLLKAAVLVPTIARAEVATCLAQDSNFSFGSPAQERLDQGPFDIDQDQGWQTVLFTTPSERPLRNPGFGLVGYSWKRVDLRWQRGPVASCRIHQRKSA